MIMELLTTVIEEEKKPLLSMLGKLYITANSNPEKLSSVSELVAEAIDLKVATDAPSRNALTKLHGSLGKVVGEAGAVKKRVEEGATVLDEGKTIAEEDEAEAPALASEEDVKMEIEEQEDMTKLKDSLLEELLDDEDEEL